MAHGVPATATVPKRRAGIAPLDPESLALQSVHTLRGSIGAEPPAGLDTNRTRLGVARNARGRLRWSSAAENDRVHAPNARGGSVMKLNDEDVARFNEQGYLFWPSRFSPDEVAVLRQAADEVYAMDRKEVWRESSGVARTAFAAHHLSRGIPPPGAPPPPHRGSDAARRRPGVHAPVQGQRQGRVRRRGLAMAPGLRHLASRRRDAGTARDEHRGVPRRGDRRQTGRCCSSRRATSRASSRPGTTWRPRPTRCGRSTAPRSRSSPSREGAWPRPGPPAA